MVKQVLIEKYVGHWKQIEYEVMRDSKGNSVIICNMENMLAMRVHTGDNIVVAPSQTLNNFEYHMLRSAPQRATAYCGVIGECNIQFGLDVESDKFCAIEINARLSRSSALASKATGYPLAYMAAKLGLGYSLPELINRITKATTACFEPSLDYVVIKMPRWDFRKFELVKRKLGSTMKSVGEVMAIGRNFEETFQKAIRMSDNGKDGLVANDERIWYDSGAGRHNNIAKTLSINDNPTQSTTAADLVEKNTESIEQELLYPNDEIIFSIVEASRRGMTIDRISELSAIDPWFLMRINNILMMEDNLRKSNFDEGLIRQAKKIGFSDKQIGRCMNIDEFKIRSLRQKFGIKPVIKQIDTLSAEWPAKTNYLYLTYGGETDDVVVDPANKESRTIVPWCRPIQNWKQRGI